MYIFIITLPLQLNDNEGSGAYPNTFQCCLLGIVRLLTKLGKSSS